MSAPHKHADDSHRLDRGSSHASASIVESGLKYFAMYSAVTLFLMTALGIGVGIAIDRASVSYDHAEDARVEQRVTQSKIESMRNELAEQRGMNEAKPRR